MKPSLEILELDSSQKSFNFFKVEVEQFEPYWHYHPELELTLITKGQGTRFVGNSILPYYGYDLILIGENVPHNWVSLKRDHTTTQEAYVIQFPKDVFKHIRECNPLDLLFKEAELGLQFTQPNEHIIKSIMEFDKGNKIKQVSQLMDILNVLQTDTNRRSLCKVAYKTASLKSAQQDKVNETISYILENLDKKLTVNILADQVHMVPQSFCRWFKQAVGNSFVTFLNTARIEQACQLLLTTETPIQQIAYDSGFDSLSHFNRTFKKIKQKSPREFRSSMAV